jgi:hypothetical protein
MFAIGLRSGSIQYRFVEMYVFVSSAQTVSLRRCASARPPDTAAASLRGYDSTSGRGSQKCRPMKSHQNVAAVVNDKTAHCRIWTSTLL